MSSDDAWTAAALPDQSGRRVVVTGANSGLGFEATRAFARAGAHVVMACRSTERGEDARDDIVAELPGASLTVHELDLAALDSVAAFADWFTAEFDSLHVLANNAGVMAIPRSETADGFETQFGVNHLGHVALTAGLLGVLRRTSGETRVVTQSSGAHRRGRIDFEDLQHEAEYGKWEAYSQSKLANLLFAYELDRRLRAASASVTSVACHPGYAATNLQLRGPQAAGSRLRLLAMRAANALVGQSAEQGAWPLLYAATNPSIDGGEYIGPGGVLNMRGHPERQQPSARSRDEDTARRLWTVSADRTGVDFDLPDPA
ncbi:oxidoreductase [Halobacterium salinarum]|uniref:NAD(P)-dependent dehydrogenase, short-chain alcohol dehydrogenase family n=5 Tax=Halobacterium salinarum TaxID=2242 RepID=A0A4D6GRL7_HALS9|nr:oxidoreductase [Halobacterium salinarum]AAG19016.1 probable oxidoreductase [Halobacterium salinarum NRC-1]MBB6089851.1 NAD(P)-dependent dehydrogenase (short-subunit alcohol dehydrogenase family) [Halobacterium salinarum]MDL0125181.1 oxidoreductase [Halobacterium salinarum]MDL0129646.1 oxidoreductase [Halobacterium salinarum]MDL0136715.1 oxidoreductase [Halobacterium salinarum]